MMVCTEGNTNRECCFFWGGTVGFDGWKWTKSRLRRKKTQLWLAWQNRGCRQLQGVWLWGLGCGWNVRAMSLGDGRFRAIPFDTHPWPHALATTPYSPLFPNRLSLFLTNPLFVNFPSRQSKHPSIELVLFWMSHGKKRNKIKYVGIKFGNNTKLFYLCGNFSLIVEGCKKP